MEREEYLRRMVGLHKGSRITGDLKTVFDGLNWHGFYPVVNTAGELTGQLAGITEADFQNVAILPDGTPKLDPHAVDAVVSDDDALILNHRSGS